MLRKCGKLPYFMMAMVLLLNLLSPSGLVSAAAAAVGNPGDTAAAVIGDDETTPAGTGDEIAAPGAEGSAGTDTSAGNPDGAAGDGTQPPSDAPAQGQIVSENIITDLIIKDENGSNIKEVRVDQGAKVQVNVYWKLPAGHAYKDGAVFTFQLPENFKVTKALTDDLDGSGQSVGTYVVTPEGQVTFTFNKEIENQEMDGYFFVWREFDASKLSNNTKQDMIVKVYDENITIPVHFKSNSNREIDKAGKPDKAMNPGRIDWSVDFNKGERVIKNPLFKDTPDAGLTLDPASLKVHTLQVQLDGKVVEKDPVAEDQYVLKQTGDGFELQFSGQSDQAYRVKYATTIDVPSNKAYNNTVRVEGEGLTNPLEKSAGADVKYSQPLGKKSTGYDQNSQTITWAVQYNYNEQSIPQDIAWIDDKFDTTSQDLLDDSFSVFKMNIEDSGQASKTGTKLVTGADYTVTKNGEGFRFQFTSAVDAAYEIVYNTKASGRVHDDKVSVENTVVMPGVAPVTIQQDIKQVIFWKTYTKIHYDNKKIDWKLSLNDDKKTMSDVVITDSFQNQDMELDPVSVKIGDLIQDTDYTLVPDPDYKAGFKITFLHDISSNYVITYTTKFDPTTKKRAAYDNTAELNWKEDGNQQPSISKTVSKPVDNYTKDNGGKTGEYNAITKEITWTLNVNYNLYAITKAVVRDFYTGEQTFVADSLTVTPLKLSDTDNKVSVDGMPLELGKDYSYELKKEDGKDGFELIFNKPINSAYQITYKTSLEDHPVTKQYSNQAELFDANEPGTKLYTKSATVKPQYGGEYIVKTGKQGTGANEDFAYWTLNLNNSQSTVANAVVMDVLSPNQILLPASFKLYSTEVAKNGSLTKGALVKADEYTLTVKDNSFELAFKKPLHRAYVLEYQSFINADNGEQITNNASFGGQASGTVGGSQNEEVVVAFAGAGGGAQPGKGDLNVVKVDAKTGVVLPDAHFALYDKTGNTILEELVTDAQGEASFKNYRYNDYILKELSAPTGYLIDDAYLNGQKISLKASTVIIKVTNTQGVWDYELTKVDKDDHARPLEGAVFKLQMKKGPNFEDVPGKTELTTNADGKILLAHLDAGVYQFIETKAPKGYKLDQTPITFTIDANQAVTKKVTVANEIYVGSVQLTKTDGYDGAPLAGAEFELQKEDGTPVQTGLTTDADGKIIVTGLKAGSYLFIEKKAPENYQLNASPLEFEIVDDQLLPVSFTNDLIMGSAKLTKIQTGRLDLPLQGAVFRILDQDKKPVKDADGKELAGLITDAHGELTVSDLRPGTYYAEETAAPSGYWIKNALTEFEIKREQVTLITVENNRIIPGGGGGGGGGGTIDPNPPVTPNPDPQTPTTPNPDPGTPSTPETPSVPGTVVELGTPSESGGSVIPGQPDRGALPGSNGSGKQPDAGNDKGMPGEGKDGAVPDGSGEGMKPNPQGGSVLPKTGEDSHRPLQFAGFGLIALGGVLLFRKMHINHKL